MPKQCTDTYGEPTVFQYGNITGRLYHPILTEEERAVRMKRIHDTAARILLSLYEREEEEKKAAN